MKNKKEDLIHNSSIVEQDILPEDYQFNLSDFALFLFVMKRRKAYECTLSIILDEPNIKLADVKVEQVVLNKSGKRAIRLDAWAMSTDNRQFNMEMENHSKKDFLPKHSRYYQGMLDSPILKSGKKTKYKHLPSTVIIFITQDDLFGKDLARYTFTEQCEEVENLHLDDGTKKIFLNMISKNGSKELVSLLQYMKETDIENPEIVVKDERIIELDHIVTEVKESEEWEAVKMNILEVGIKKGEALGEARGEARGLERGIEAFVLDNREENVPEERIIAKLAKRFELTEEKANEYYKQYAK
ncbi:Rpn family recombination-promoting nuclease/putative transposase [Hespellia stercorisuis]|uniref:PD-(D/E)XK nuclease family transposase n=1 Tax=Hespellia stercorisuis DSM 15480 TaxID=1121950 RepID=A0A1M6I1C8_9FIRM|nr:Rpn family recombination-promoting nuclease/putative transposase [Hespellia stercorisuis]SHJ28289.1 conserved hypothetical protein (putative transposase or invertase) [Hespellia stercorisuis DSM 15480]